MTPTSPMADLADLRARRSAKWSMYPDDVLPLFVAEMDVHLAPAITRTLAEAIERSDTGYAAPATGLPSAFSEFAARRWDWGVDAEQVSLAPDISVAMVETLRALPDRPATIAISPPIYPPFYEWVREVGARSLEVPLRDAGDEGLRLDLAALEVAFRAGADVFLLCNPHNPVGTVHTRAELEALAELAVRYDVTVVADEIHAPLVLPGAAFAPFLGVSDDARRCGIALVSASKGWNLAGLKCAMIVTAGGRTAGVHRRLPGELPWRTGHLGVLASTAAYRAGEAWLDAVIGVLDENRTLLVELLAECLPDVRYRPPQASYLAWLDFRRVPGVTELRGPSELADDVLQRCGVALSAGADFGPPGASHLRLNFGTSPEILRAATRRLAGYAPGGS